MSYSIHRRTIGCALALFALGAVACGSDGDDTNQASVDTEVASSSEVLGVDEFADYLDTTPSAVLVNVHIPYEGHIDGTDDFVPFDGIGTWDGLPADRAVPIALYCRSGSMSAQASATLVELGYTNVIDLEGGMNAWTAAGNQLETSR